MGLPPDNNTPNRFEQNLWEIQGLIHGLSANVVEFKDQARRQEDRSNSERAALTQSVDKLREKQIDFTSEVRTRLDSLAGQVKDFSTTQQIVATMNEKVTAVAAKVEKMETPFTRM